MFFLEFTEDTVQCTVPVSPSTQTCDFVVARAVLRYKCSGSVQYL